MKKEKINEKLRDLALWGAISGIILGIILLFTIPTKAQVSYLGKSISIVLKDTRFKYAEVGITDDKSTYYAIEDANGSTHSAVYVKKGSNTVSMVRLLGYSHKSVITYLDDISSKGASFNGEYWTFNNVKFYIYEREYGYVFEYYLKE